MIIRRRRKARVHPEFTVHVSFSLHIHKARPKQKAPLLLLLLLHFIMPYTKWQHVSKTMYPIKKRQRNTIKRCQPRDNSRPTVRSLDAHLVQREFVGGGIQPGCGFQPLVDARPHHGAVGGAGAGLDLLPVEARQLHLKRVGETLHKQTRFGETLTLTLILNLSFLLMVRFFLCCLRRSHVQQRSRVGPIVSKTNRWLFCLGGGNQTDVHT